MKLQRMCAVCRELKSKEQLIRVVKQKETVLIDHAGKTLGRGAYLCKGAACISKARKARALERSLSCKIDDAIYDELETLAASDGYGE